MEFNGVNNNELNILHNLEYCGKNHPVGSNKSAGPAVVPRTQLYKKSTSVHLAVLLFYIFGDKLEIVDESTA